jgi:hypothetical protein
VGAAPGPDFGLESRLVASPARKTAAPERPPVDPAIDRAYRAQRARRKAKAHHARSQQLAARRFAFLLLVLTVCGVFLIVTIWTTMHQLFGF